MKGTVRKQNEDRFTIEACCKIFGVFLGALYDAKAGFIAPHCLAGRGPLRAKYQTMLTPAAADAEGWRWQADRVLWRFRRAR